MKQASLFSLLLFVSTLLVVLGGILWGVWTQREGKAPLPLQSRTTTTLLLLVWLALTAGLAWSGMLRRFDQLPPPFGLLLLTMVLLVSFLAFSKVGTHLISRVGLIGIVGFQAFRIPVEICLHWLYLENIVPIQMTYEGRNFDIISGVSALLVAGLLYAGKCPKWLLLLWNIVGLGLLINIVSIAILSAPFPFRMFMNEPANTFVTYIPFIWLPMLLVAAAFLGHLLVFRAIKEP